MILIAQNVLKSDVGYVNCHEDDHSDDGYNHASSRKTPTQNLRAQGIIGAGSYNKQIIFSSVITHEIYATYRPFF